MCIVAFVFNFLQPRIKKLKFLSFLSLLVYRVQTKASSRNVKKPGWMDGGRDEKFHVCLKRRKHKKKEVEISTYIWNCCVTLEVPQMLLSFIFIFLLFSFSLRRCRRNENKNGNTAFGVTLVCFVSWFFSYLLFFSFLLCYSFRISHLIVSIINEVHSKCLCMHMTNFYETLNIKRAFAWGIFFLLSSLLSTLLLRRCDIKRVHAFVIKV